MTENVLDKDYLTLKGKERDKWLREKQNEIMTRVRDFSISDEDKLELLKFMSKFHNYSFRNQMLIEEQWRGAQAVASYNKWKKLGYPVKKGEKGRILIWVRTKYRIIYLDDGTQVQWHKATKEQKRQAETGELEMEEKVTYKSGFVFDISQTSAKPEDLPKIFPNKHCNFDVDEDVYQTMLEGVDAIAKEIGTELFWDEEDVLGNAKGMFVHERNIILMNKRDTPSETVSVGIHELAHAYLHKNRKDLSKSIKELQAELTSALVCSVYGMDTLEESVKYINSWTKNENIKEAKMDEILEEVQNTVKKFTYIIDKQFKLEKEESE